MDSQKSVRPSHSMSVTWWVTKQIASRKTFSSERKGRKIKDFYFKPSTFQKALSKEIT